MHFALERAVPTTRKWSKENAAMSPLNNLPGSRNTVVQRHLSGPSGPAASRHARRRPTMQDDRQGRSGVGRGAVPTTGPSPRPSRSTSSKPPLNDLPAPGGSPAGIATVLRDAPPGAGPAGTCPPTEISATGRALGRGPGRCGPGPACVMRAQRDGVHPGSRRASSARRNPPALDSCEPASHNASPGDIANSTPPGRSVP